MKILLLDEGQQQSLYLSRKLQECAAADPTFAVAIASSNPHQQIALSYFPVTSHPTSDPTDPGYAGQIGELARDHDVIIPIGNNCLPVAYAANTPWRGKVFPAIAPDTFALLFDKFASTQLAMQLGIRCPETVAVESLEALDLALERLGLPIVLKRRSGWAGDGVRICATREELVAAVHLFRSHGDHRLFCQRYIRGAPSLAGGLFAAGDALRIYCADHDMSYPPVTGASKSLISRRDQVMVDALVTFCQAVRWTGLGNMDFVRGDDGKLYFLEFNPRIWGSIVAAEDAGVDMVGPLPHVIRGEFVAPDLGFESGVYSALFPQYLLSLCQQGGYRNLGRVVGDLKLWRHAPWNRPRYLFGYLTIIAGAWLYGLWRTMAGDLMEPVAGP